MREPIQPMNVRAGDTIRVEWTRDQCGTRRALEYVAPNNGTGMRKKMSAIEWDSAEHYLIERPAPAVDLPVKPTLGRVEFDDGDWFIGTVQANADGRTFTAARHDTGYYSALWNAAKVNAFTPAVAVPAEALDVLREVAGFFGRGLENAFTSLHLRRGIETFLAAVDNANEATR